MTKPVLLFAYGNLSRGDDALGPLLLEHIQGQLDADRIEILTDFQLQIEHALDLQQRELVLFVDASVAGNKAINFTELQPSRDRSYTTHAMSPAAVLDVYRSIHQHMPPPSFLLSIRAEQMELGEGLSAQASQNLLTACAFALTLLHQCDVQYWRQQLTA